MKPASQLAEKRPVLATGLFYLEFPILSGFTKSPAAVKQQDPHGLTSILYFVNFSHNRNKGKISMQLTPTQQRFILHWGEMGTRWGINRSMAQIHALLYLAPEPLNAETLAETLEVARSNVSNSLRELQGWGIVRMVHVFGDRRDHFETVKDPWALFRAILEERKRREIDPTIATLRACLEERDDGDTQHTRDQLAAMLEFFELTNSWYQVMQRLPASALVRFVKMGDKIPKKLGIVA